MKGLNVLCWSLNSDVLAVGSQKGNLLLYNRRTSKKIPVMGKHSKAIVCAAWNKEGLLACGSLDFTFTLSNMTGDTWSTMKTSSTAEASAVLSILAFQSKYGNIVSYSWFGDGLVMIGFSVGYFVVVSTNMNEIGQELFQTRNHKDTLCNIAVNPMISKAATCGDGSVKVHELTDLKDVYAILDLEDERGALEALDWTDDGGFLTVGTKSGNIYTFLSRLPILGNSFGPVTAHLTGICEITVTNHDKTLQSFQLKRDLGVEPSVIGVGPYHWAIGLNDRLSFYFGGWGRRPLKWGKMRPNEPTGKMGEMVFEREYIGTVKNGRLQVHALDPRSANGQGFQRVFPDKDILSKYGENGSQIVSAHITNEMLIYAMAAGVIHHYSVEEWSLVHEFKHKKGVVSVFPRPASAKLVFRDEVNDFFLLDPVKDAKTTTVLWEACPNPDRTVFVSYDDAPQCLSLGTTKLPYGLKPIIFIDGSVLCQLMTIFLTTNEPLASKNIAALTEQAQGKSLQLAYTLGIMSAWTMLAEAALYVLDITTAKRVYRQILHDAGMVMTLSSYAEYEEINILAGYICIIFREFEHAQEFTSFSEKLAPKEVTGIAREYAGQLESGEKFSEALSMYEMALETSNEFRASESERDEHQIVCSSGITRMTFRMGDVTRGMKMLNGVDEIKLLQDCAGILEGLKLYSEAGGLFERAGAWEKQLRPILKGSCGRRWEIFWRRLRVQRFLCSMQKRKKYVEAAASYEKARDFDNVVRLCVEHLNQIDKAVKIVRDTRSRESARIVSKFFQARQEYNSVVEFCLMAGMVDEAFELAQQHDVMEHFGVLIKGNANPQMLANIATYFENKRQLLNAGKYYLQAGDHAKALRLFIRCPVLDGESIEKAIEAVGLAKNDALTHELIDYLMVYFQALYVFGVYRDAARTAIIIAREEQTLEWQTISPNSGARCPILTSTVIECYRANMKKEAFEYAAMLMRPEYRPLLDAKYKRKIEQIVRNFDPCPFCGYKLAESVLDCTDCKNHIPYCIASGRHMELDNWSTCPNCEFPALTTEFQQLVDKTEQCPMCCFKLAPQQIKPSSNPRELLRGAKDISGDDKAIKGLNGDKKDEYGSMDALGASLSALESSVPIVAASRGLGSASTASSMKGASNFLEMFWEHVHEGRARHGCWALQEHLTLGTAR
ncbi:hypothetical protein BC829DRAFT_409646 [Chytridium lagenaria]|nr:hypothetical protein BC829DRAFT_409646 [Chytridium lagenaria]